MKTKAIALVLFRQRSKAITMHITKDTIEIELIRAHGIQYIVEHLIVFLVAVWNFEHCLISP